MSVDISSPEPNGTVDRTFTAEGGYDVTNVANPAGAKVVCWITDQQGQEKDSGNFPIPAPEMNPVGDWQVELQLDDDYVGCTVFARIYIGNVPNGNPASVSPVKVEAPT